MGSGYGLPADAIWLPVYLLPPTISCLCLYTYDMGDNWHHQIVMEAIQPGVKTAVYPRCLAGERACPPEDCGGVVGYIHFLEATENPDHPRHKQ